MNPLHSTIEEFVAEDMRTSSASALPRDPPAAYELAAANLAFSAMSDRVQPTPRLQSGGNLRFVRVERRGNP
jgi:hypothetical protein